jgi:peptidoglycan/xylan/chitin deacetylase (PgdA/CDA1 family)
MARWRFGAAGTGSPESLSLPPRIVPVAKAGLTRARSIAWLAAGRSEARSGLRILFYHRVSDDRDPLAVRPSAFRRQMEFLASAGWKAVDVATAATVLAASGGSGHGRAKVVGLSFDDGYRDVAEAALPELDRHGFSATVFVVPRVVDGTAQLTWYSRQPPVLDWDEIVQLHAHGTLRFGAHTLTHRNLVELSKADARAEIAGSKLALEKRLRSEISEFCYPAGLLSPRERQLVEGAGFTAAVTCEPGPNEPGADLLLLRRIAVERGDGMLDFRAKLLGGHDRPLPFRSVYRRVRFGSSAAQSTG